MQNKKTNNKKNTLYENLKKLEKIRARIKPVPQEDIIRVVTKYYKDTQVSTLKHIRKAFKEAGFK